ncbi:Cro/C1-type helix-turn-helix domain [Methylophilaceae bacterium]|jgi:transcriptional regulator with XRE-family HTH domain
MIISEQIRAARQLVKITAEILAEKSGVGVATIRRYELMSGIPSGNARSIDALQKALESLGVEFIGTPEDGPGVRLVKK